MSKKNCELDAAAVSRIMSATAKVNGGRIPKGGFAPKAQSVVAKRSASTSPRKK